MRNALLFLASLLISLLLAEGVLHVVHPFDRMQTWIEMSDRGYVMNRAGGTAIHELDGTAVTYTFDADRFRVGRDDPRVVPRADGPDGAANGARARENGADTLANGARADTLANGADAIRPYTVLLGDSYAFGLHLADTVSLAHRMGWRNFAVGGAGPADYLAQMRDFLPRWQNVDTVVVLLSIDDATRTLGRDLIRLDGESQRWRNSAFRGFMEALPGYHPFRNTATCSTGSCASPGRDGISMS